MRLPGFLRNVPLCRIDRHDPVRDRVKWHAGYENYVGRCRHCGKAIRRLQRRRWIAIDESDLTN